MALVILIYAALAITSTLRGVESAVLTPDISSKDNGHVLDLRQQACVLPFDCPSSHPICNNNVCVCTVDGNPGDGTAKGSCAEPYQVCKADGTCAGCNVPFDCPEALPICKNNVCVCTVDGKPGDGTAKGSCTEAYQVCKDDGTCAGCSKYPYAYYAVGNGKTKGSCPNVGEYCQADGTCYASTYQKMENKACARPGYRNSPEGAKAVCDQKKTGCKGYQAAGNVGKACKGDVKLDGTGLKDSKGTTVFVKTN